MGLSSKSTGSRRNVSMLLVVVLVALLSGTNALFEDQIKKFDWLSLQIGAPQHTHLELNGFQARLLVSTKENVIAALCPKTGELLWRQVFETGTRGDIKLLQVGAAGEDTPSTAAARPHSSHGFDMLTVQGEAPALVRGWNANTGGLEWEWSLLPLQTERADAAFWLYSNSLLYHVLPVWRSHLEVTPYFATTGRATGATSRITAPWIDAGSCVRSGVFYVCLDGNQLISLDLLAAQPQVFKKSLPTVPKDKIKALEGANGVLIIDKVLVSIKDDIKTCTNLRSDSFLLGQLEERRVIAQADVVNNMLEIRVFDGDSCEAIDELTQRWPYPEHHGMPTLSSFDCKARRSSDGKTGNGCLFLLGTVDEALLAIQRDKLRWRRDEALANVVASEFIDLPLADAEGTLESEMKGNTGDIASAFVRRISTQLLLMKSTLFHVLGLGPPPSDTQKAGLVHDSFGLHKMLVVLTRSGKIFGIDNISAKHHWQRYLPNVAHFGNEERMRLLVQRTSKHFPLQPLCTVVASDKKTGNGVLFRFNPITGQPAEGGLLQLNYKIKQLSLLAEAETDYVKGLLILAADNTLSVHPATATQQANGLYFFVADKTKSELNGYYLKLTGEKLNAKAIWNVRLGGPTGDQKIINVAHKNPIEHVHSQGRVLPDRSVLYKYINPNLVAVVTQGPDNIHKTILNVYLIDVVSGSVVFSMTHRKVRAPVHIVHSENWLVYSYYNDRVRRSELTTIELYEGKTQANSTIWSSLNAPPMPLIERQSYIIPAVVSTMRETITERGITNKHILVGISSGSIVEVPWVLLDPRRPILTSNQPMEEGGIPYIPELPLPTENKINYNQTVARLSSIQTAPSGLESTCLVVATGLDMFVTRVAPSRTFDLLKEDFDYYLITIVLVVLTSGSLVIRYLASRKILKQAWK